jgi:hypothetical protein
MAAPKGNRFALGHGWGRPPMYETPEQLIAEVEKYFEYETNSSGVCKPTISGMIYWLGFSNRQSWYDYCKKKDFMDTCKRIEGFIESCYEKNLHGFAWAGSAFALRNIRGEYWKEETTQNQIVNNVRADFGGVVQTSSQTENNT